MEVDYSSINFKMLKCVREIPSCKGLKVGDLIYRIGGEIQPGGYEYVLVRRSRDSRVFGVRQEHLEDHFDVVEVGVDGKER